MKRAIGIAIVLTVGACALLAGPASAKRHGPAVRVALQACKQERGDLGVAAFRGKYGRRAMRNCLPQTTIETPNAPQAGRAELADIGIDAFREEHGTNQNGRNAFGKCVSETVTGDDASGGDSAPDQSGDETCDNSSPGGDETNPAVAVRDDEVSDEDESSD